MSPQQFTITVRTEPGFRGTLPQRLRLFLKVALRAFGIRCVKIEPVADKVAEDSSELHWEWQ